MESIFDDYIPGLLGFILKKFGYNTNNYPYYKTFYIRRGIKFSRVWIGGFSPTKDMIPAPTWRMLWDDLFSSQH